MEFLETIILKVKEKTRHRKSFHIQIFACVTEYDIPTVAAFYLSYLLYGIQWLSDCWSQEQKQNGYNSPIHMSRSE